jgi:hypothetical protein
VPPEQSTRYQGDDVREEDGGERGRIRRHSPRRHDRHGSAGARETDPDNNEVEPPQRRPERRLTRTLFGVERIDAEVRADGRPDQGDGTFPPPIGCGVHSKPGMKANR